MATHNNIEESSGSRREFLKGTGSILAGAALGRAISSRAYAGEDDTIKIALVGCGGRGTGAAADALQTEGPTKLVAAADVFEKRIAKAVNSVLERRSADEVDVPEGRQFVGFDGYRKAIDLVAPDGVVLLATPPAFRPLHLEYAVEKGCHVFMEKSFAVDAPGVRRVLKAGKEAERKNLKIAGGLMSRHYVPLEQAVEQLHKGCTRAQSAT
jgi:predicted dehydrogenase